MKTNRPNWDYEKTVVITPQLVKLCDQCGAPMVNRYEVFHCSGCRSTTFEVLYDNQAEAFRRGLQEKQEEAQLIAEARRIALSLAPQMDVALEFIAVALNMDAGTEALLNSWIAEKDPRTPAQRDLDAWQADASATRRMDEPR